MKNIVEYTDMKFYNMMLWLNAIYMKILFDINNSNILLWYKINMTIIFFLFNNIIISNNYNLRLLE